MADHGLVYCVTRLSTGQRYVGVTIRTVEGRWAKHVSASCRGAAPLPTAIRADGPDGFALSILERDIPVRDIPDRERHWIATLGTVFPGGLNANRGGGSTTRNRAGVARRARELQDETGACFNTAKRWVREGRAPAAARVYRKHGRTGSRAFVRWHDMKRKGGLSPEWSDFDRFARDLVSLIPPAGYRLGRADRGQPWGPDNITLERYGAR